MSYAQDQSSLFSSWSDLKTLENLLDQLEKVSNGDFEGLCGILLPDLEDLEKLWDQFRDKPSYQKYEHVGHGTSFQDYENTIFQDKRGEILKQHLPENGLCGENNSLCEKGLRVYSDKDDTTLCSGGVAGMGFAGIDKHCITHALYPGMVAFYLALLQSHDPSPPSKKYTEISARPDVTSGGSFDKISKAIYRIFYYGSKRDRSVDTDSETLPGTDADSILGREARGGSLLRSALAAIKSKCFNDNNWLSVAMEKVDQIRDVEKGNERNTGYNKKAKVWIGDDGQGDAYVGRWMQEEFLVSFVRRVNFLNYGLLSPPDKFKSLTQDSSGLVYFYSFPEAARMAANDLEIITQKSYHNVLKETLESALGEACCNKKKCDKEKNKEDGTCGDQEHYKPDEIYEFKTFSPIKNNEYNPCRDILDAVEFAREENMNFTCPEAPANLATANAATTFTTLSLTAAVLLLAA